MKFATTSIGILSVLLAVPGHAAGEESVLQSHRACSAPFAQNGSSNLHYEVGVKEHNVGQPPALFLQISITSEQAASEKALVRLGCQLSADFPRETEIHALVFDDKEAARRLALRAEDQARHGAYLWHLRARYELHRGASPKTQFIEFLIPYVEDGLLSVKRARVWIDF